MLRLENIISTNLLDVIKLSLVHLVYIVFPSFQDLPEADGCYDTFPSLDNLNCEGQMELYNQFNLQTTPFHLPQVSICVCMYGCINIVVIYTHVVLSLQVCSSTILAAILCILVCVCVYVINLRITVCNENKGLNDDKKILILTT